MYGYYDIKFRLLRELSDKTHLLKNLSTIGSRNYRHLIKYMHYTEIYCSMVILTIIKEETEFHVRIAIPIYLYENCNP